MKKLFKTMITMCFLVTASTALAQDKYIAVDATAQRVFDNGTFFITKNKAFAFDTDKTNFKAGKEYTLIIKEGELSRTETKTVKVVNSWLSRGQVAGETQFTLDSLAGVKYVKENR